jgi:Coenzyme PQQ synthesis protein D (PqqD)
MLTLDSIVQRDSEVMTAEADQDLMMVSVATGNYYAVSNVARQIWDAIGHPTKVSDLVGNLMESYKIDLASCEEQTLSFLEALLNEGLLKAKDESAG